MHGKRGCLNVSIINLKVKKKFIIKNGKKEKIKKIKISWVVIKTRKK